MSINSAGVSVVLSTGLHFDPGVLYEYEYSTSMEVAPISEDFGEATAFTVLATIHIHSLWRNSQQEQLLQLQVSFILEIKVKVKLKEFYNCL